MSQVVVVGASFAGLTAALELRRLLPDSGKILMVSASDKFYFLASLIWVVQGWREIEDISFDVRPVLAESGIDSEVLATTYDPSEAVTTMDDYYTANPDVDLWLVQGTGGQDPFFTFRESAGVGEDEIRQCGFDVSPKVTASILAGASGCPAPVWWCKKRLSYKNPVAIRLPPSVSCSR